MTSAIPGPLRTAAAAALVALLAAPAAHGQNAVCAETSKFCSRSLDNRCLTRFGAGVIGLPGEEPGAKCVAQLAEYRDCLSLVAAQCPQQGALERARPKEAPTATASALEIWTEIKDFEDADVFEAFAETYPTSPLSVLAAKRAAAIRAAALTSAGDAQALEPGGEETEEQERAALDEEDRLRAQFEEGQRQLNRIGYDAGPVDGEWGSRSGTALAHFLTDQGRPPSRILTPGELALLRAAPSGSAPTRAKDERGGEPKSGATAKSGGRTAALHVTFRYRDRTTLRCSTRARTSGGAINVQRLRLSCGGRTAAYVWLKTDSSGRGLSVQVELEGDRVTLNGTRWRYSGLRIASNNKNALRSAKLSVSF